MQPLPRDLDPKFDVRSIRAARFVSDILSPPMVYALLGFVVALASLPSWLGLAWGALYGFFVSLIPILVVIYMLKSGRIQDMHMSDTRQRRLPYLVGIVGALVAYGLISWLAGPPLLVSLAAGTVIGLTAMGVINNFWLISNHMGSITMAALFIAFGFGFAAGLATAPLVVLVFLARWTLRRHTLTQLFAGMAVGVLTVWILVFIGLL